MTRVLFHENNTVSLHVDDQHISRLSPRELRDLILQCLMFGGKQLREEVRGWLTDEQFAATADTLSAQNAGKS